MANNRHQHIKRFAHFHLFLLNPLSGIYLMPTPNPQSLNTGPGALGPRQRNRRIRIRTRSRQHEKSDRQLCLSLWPFPALLAEREGFEPPVQLPVHRISSAARSTTPASLRVSLLRIGLLSCPGASRNVQKHRFGTANIDIIFIFAHSEAKKSSP